MYQRKSDMHICANTVLHIIAFHLQVTGHGLPMGCYWTKPKPDPDDSEEVRSGQGSPSLRQSPRDSAQHAVVRVCMHWKLLATLSHLDMYSV